MGRVWPVTGAITRSTSLIRAASPRRSSGPSSASRSGRKRHIAPDRETAGQYPGGNDMEKRLQLEKNHDKENEDCAGSGTRAGGTYRGGSRPSVHLGRAGPGHVRASQAAAGGEDGGFEGPSGGGKG